VELHETLYIPASLTNLDTLKKGLNIDIFANFGSVIYLFA
jgi:hypothetical protein